MNKYCYWWILPVLLGMLTACGDDEYHYPSVKLEFMTARSGADGYLQSVVTDAGETLPVVEDATETRVEVNTSFRIISNYAPAVAADGTGGVKLYALSGVFAAEPQAANTFEEGVKTDPVNVLSIWMGFDFINMILDVKESGGHKFNFVEDKVTVDAATGYSDVYLTLYHDAEKEEVSYTRRAYASIPLRQYVVEGVQKIRVYLSIHTYSGDIKTYDFVYLF